MRYQVKTPWWLKRLYPRSLIWDMPAGAEPAVYLSFDDGPCPVITSFVLEQLKLFGAKATFFCIGRNVDAHPDLYRQILAEGHTTGNHTHRHLNGWKTSTDTYIEDISTAATYIDTQIFRPPYGRIKRSQISLLQQAAPPWKIYMWDVLSGDFDTRLTGEDCAKNVVSNIESGSIVVFHDSEKAWERMRHALPRVLQHCQDRNWTMKALPL